MSEHQAQRLKHLRALLVEHELDQLLVTDLTNVRYLSGFTGTNGLLVIGADTAVLLTDFRYVTQAGEQVKVYEVRDAGREPRQTLAQLLAGRVGFDDAHMTVRAHGRISEDAGAGVELEPAAGLVERLRRVKDAAELAHISTAASIADRIYGRLCEDGIVGHTEQQVAWRIEVLAREFGAERLAFPPIVAAGAHGALPHAEPRNVAIRKGQMVVVDLGCVVSGYCSDATRTVVAGTADDRHRELYAVVREAQEAALEAVLPGVEGATVDAVARDLIAAAGYGEHFGHSLGHGVGLEVHEGPTLSAKSEDILAVGNVVTIEPGIYLEGELGVRIEDLVVVDDDGPHVLSGFGKDLLEIP
jgi:Xaa-Pro aminopeptidase